MNKRSHAAGRYVSVFFFSMRIDEAWYYYYDIINPIIIEL